MKKVRYAVGAAGVVPVLGLMAAAAPAQSAGKTVSLRHSGVSVAATGCTANTLATAGAHSVRMSFWHKYNPTYGTSCIGTLITDFSQLVYSSSYDRVRIYAHSLGGGHPKVFSHHYKGADFGKFKFSVGIHQSFAYPPIQVCTAGVNLLGNVTMGPLCKSVG